MAKEGDKGAIKPTALTAEDAAKLLSRAGGEAISAAAIRQDIERGAPQNRDGTLHLVHYTAWLAGRVP